MKKKRKGRPPQFGFQVNQKLLDDLREISEQMEIPASQIAREAVKEKIASLKQSLENETAQEAAVI